mmetsp:Transcript_23595/g.54520  ORF Transcript_23595/g.54520 Transcript_23595/m.54520 type:complete len:200 (-) Transcript_23595:313-912(-)
MVSLRNASSVGSSSDFQYRSQAWPVSLPPSNHVNRFPVGVNLQVICGSCKCLTRPTPRSASQTMLRLHWSPRISSSSFLPSSALLTHSMWTLTLAPSHSPIQAPASWCGNRFCMSETASLNWLIILKSELVSPQCCGNHIVRSQRRRARTSQLPSCRGLLYVTTSCSRGIPLDNSHIKAVRPPSVSGSTVAPRSTLAFA